MKTSRRRFLQASAATAAAGIHEPTAAKSLPWFHASPSTPLSESLDGFRIARRHKIARDLPTPTFFEGMLLGNGDVGVCVTVRPDALGLHLGKSDSWDIRVSEDHYKHVLTFQELLKLWERAGQEAKRQGKPDMLYLESNIGFFRQYTEKVAASYRKPWPRPWPCGIVWIHWDARWVPAIRQTLDPSNGLLTIELEYDNRRDPRQKVTLACFIDWETGLLSVSTDRPAPIHAVVYDPYQEVNAPLPAGEVMARGIHASGEFFYNQLFPATAPTDEVPNPPHSDKDRNLALYGRLSGLWTVESSDTRVGPGPMPFPSPQPPVTRRRTPEGPGPNVSSVSFRPDQDQPLRLELLILTSRDHPDNVQQVQKEVARLASVPVNQLQQKSEAHWKDFWARSAVEFEDGDLERIWYYNQYFLACCLREGKVAPGLFGNWTSGKIGTAWHGDYHMNYNTQQVFWGVFSSNHADQHLPYIELCENLLPMSESYAREKFDLPGAFFPHSAYPVPSQTIPYPAPPWGYEVCETPWTVQSLWWHYIYTLDRDLLKRIYPLLRASTRFLVAYVKKGPDGKYHFIPTVSPENWGFTVDYRLNKDCIIDLALTEFVLDATVEASKVLAADEDERRQWTEVRANLAPYPETSGPLGPVWADVVEAPPEHVYNVPVTLAPVFPGEQVGIGQREEQLEIARRTAATVRLEGGNDLVYQPLIRSRLGILDLDWFKQEVGYCLLPNGVANDRVRQVGGRYSDSTDFDFMMRMGVWTENLSLPAVLNECLLQSYTGTIRLFPNTQNLGRARFQHLRAVGAFLVSAAYDGKEVSEVTIHSEKGAPLRLANPWRNATVRVIRLSNNLQLEARTEDGIVTFPTEPGEGYRIEPA